MKRAFKLINIWFTISIFFIALIFFFLIPSSVSAAVSINEFVSDTEGTTADPDWVEIYNSGSESVDLSLYRLRDNTATNKLDLEGTLNAGGYVTFDWTNRLNKDGDVIKLLLISTEEIIDQVGYGDSGSDVSSPVAGQSAGRQPDGTNTWVIFGSLTKGSSNNASIPVPTATPTPTTEPTNTPTPATANTPTPTKVPTPTKTPTPTLKPKSNSPSPTPTPKAQSSAPTSVLGEKTKTNTPTPTTSSKPQGSSSDNLAKILIGLGVVFLGACGILVFRSYSKGKGDSI